MRSTKCSAHCGTCPPRACTDWSVVNPAARTSRHRPRRDALDAVHAEAQHVAVAFPGAIAERKGPNLALHWRAAPLAQDAVPRLRRRGVALAAGISRAIRRPRARTASRRRVRRQGHAPSSVPRSNRRSADAARCSSATTSPTNMPSPSSMHATASACWSAIATSSVARWQLGRSRRPCARGCTRLPPRLHRSARMTRQPTSTSASSATARSPR